MTKEEIARVLDLTPRQIQNLGAEGMPRTKTGRTWDYGADAVDWYWRRKIAALEQANGDISLEKARTRRELAQAELAEFELAQKRGEMLTVADYERELGAILSRHRSKLLNLPSKYAPELVGVRTVQEAQAELQRAIDEVLQALVRTADELEHVDVDEELPDDPPERPPRAKKSQRRRRPKKKRASS